MGPEGGSGGGTVVAEGPPEAIAQCAASHTGAFLRDVLSKPAPKPAKKTPARKSAPARKAPAARKTAARKRA